MENRERDRMSKRTSPTEAGDLNRETSQNVGRSKSTSTAEFGQKIGQSEKLENSSGGRENRDVSYGSGENRSSGSSSGRH